MLWWTVDLSAAEMDEWDSFLHLGTGFCMPIPPMPQRKAVSAASASRNWVFWRKKNTHWFWRNPQSPLGHAPTYHDLARSSAPLPSSCRIPGPASRLLVRDSQHIHPCPCRTAQMPLWFPVFVRLSVLGVNVCVFWLFGRRMRYTYEQEEDGWWCGREETRRVCVVTRPPETAPCLFLSIDLKGLLIVKVFHDCPCFDFSIKFSIWSGSSGTICPSSRTLISDSVCKLTTLALLWHDFSSGLFDFVALMLPVLVTTRLSNLVDHQWPFLPARIFLDFSLVDRRDPELCLDRWTAAAPNNYGFCLESCGCITTEQYDTDKDY